MGRPGTSVLHGEQPAAEYGANNVSSPPTVTIGEQYMGPPMASGFDGAQQGAGYGANNVSYLPTVAIGEQNMGTPAPPGFDGAQEGATYATIGEKNMGTPTPSGFDRAQHGGGHGANNVSNPPMASSIRLPDFILRSIAVVTTLIGGIVMGATKQTVIVQGLAFTVKTTGKGKSQLSFFIAANTIAFVYLAASLAMTVANRGSSAKTMKAVIAMVDLIMVGFVFSAVGAAAAFSVYLHDDDTFCISFSRYCDSIAAAIAMSTFGAAALLTLVMLVLLASVNN